MTVQTNLPPSQPPEHAPAHPALGHALHGLNDALIEFERREPPWFKRMLYRLWRLSLWSALTLYLLFCTTVLLLRHVVLPDIRAYRTQIEQTVSDAVGLPVRIADLQAGWLGLRPRLSLKQVSVYDKGGRLALQLPEVNAILSWESLAVASLRLDSLEILRPDVDVRRDASGKYFVAGLEIDDSAHTQGALSEWVLAQREIVVRGAHVRWNDEERNAPELALDDLNFALQRSGREHRFGLRATPPAALAAPIDVRGRFETPAFARVLADSDRWRGELFVRIAAADLAAWPAYVDYPISLTRGTGALRAWLGFSPKETSSGTGRRLLDLTADLRLASVITRLKNDLPALALTSVNGRLRARALPNGHEFTLTNFSLTSGDGLTVETGELSERFVAAAGGKPEQGEFRTDRLNLETLAMVTERLPVSEGLRKVLNQYQPRGTVSNVTFKWQGPIDNPVDIDLSSHFDGLSILPQAREPATDGRVRPGRPGFTNLSGAISAKTHTGIVTLAAPSSTLRFPGVFAEPALHFNHLRGEIRWTRDNDNLEVRLPALEFDNDDTSGSANVLWRTGPKSGADPRGAGWIELDGKFGRADVRRIPRYLPLTVGPQLRNWLAAALVSGSAPETSVRLAGDLERFPFTGLPALAGKGTLGKLLDRAKRTSPANTGEFRIATKVRDMRFDYDPKRAPGTPLVWPLLEELQADLIFERQGMQIRNASGSIQGMRFERVRADLDDLADPAHVLRVFGNVNGALQDYLRFVSNTPVGGWIGGFLNNARGSGTAQLDLRLELPLANLNAAKVGGGITLANNDVTLTQQGLPVMQRVSGRVDFTESAVTLRNLNGQFLGGPFRLDGGARPDGQIAIRGEGSAQTGVMRRMVDNAFLQRLSERLDGTARYSLALNLRPRDSATGSQPQLTIDSTLAGVAIDLPAPFRKTAAEALPLHLELTPQVRGAEELRITLGPSFAAVFERKPNAQGEMVVTRAAYGVNEAAVLTDSSGYANINLRTLDVDAWQTVINQLGGSAAGARAGGTLLPEVIAVRTGQLRIADKTLANVTFAASRNGDIWQANMDADQVSGYFTWREGATASQQGRLTARLARLIIPQSATSEVSSLLASSPRELPSLDIVAESFELRGKRLGHLELLADNGRGGARREWRVQKMTLTNDDAKLEASGAWTPEAGNARVMSLNFNLAAGNAGKLLDRFGINDTLRAGTSASLRGEVRWRGSPFDIDFPSLSGTLNLEAERGQFLKADPGIAKLLSVLSLQALPRRITLDFRDVFSDGFAFDSIRSAVAIENGIASTRDFNMRGPAATVLIEGSADLAHETQNLHVLVLPQINAGAGSLAYALLANPVIGLATFVAQAILRDPLSKAFSFEYNVTGSWAEPTINKLERNTATQPGGSPAPANTPNTAPTTPKAPG